MGRFDVSGMAETVDVMAQKIFYIFDESDWETRIHTAEAARDMGHDVTIGLLCEEIEAQQKSDFKTIHLSVPRQGFSLFNTFKLMRKLKCNIGMLKPDIVHIVTLKYAFILGMATLLTGGLKRVYTLAGLGYLFRGEGQKPVIMRTILAPFLFLVFNVARPHLIFQNADDQDLFTDMGFAKREHTTLIRGSGVDTDKFAVQPLPNDKKPIVLMPTRLVHNKGVSVFIEAAKIAAQKVDADFQIAGGETKHNPAAITKAEMEEMLDGAPVTWLGRVSDMPDLLTRSTLIVYPSYYGEGVPRVLLEAASVGRPIITTDNPGCKEAILDNETGILVPIKDPQATADAIVELLQNKGKLEVMASAARTYCQTEYDVRSVAKRTASLYEKI